MLEFLYSALNSPLGIVVQTDDPGRLRQKLYALRREAADESLNVLSFVPSPTDANQLWIVRRTDGRKE